METETLRNTVITLFRTKVNRTQHTAIYENPTVKQADKQQALNPSPENQMTLLLALKDALDSLGLSV